MTYKSSMKKMKDKVVDEIAESYIPLVDSKVYLITLEEMKEKIREILNKNFFSSIRKEV